MPLTWPDAGMTIVLPAAVAIGVRSTPPRWIAQFFIAGAPIEDTIEDQESPDCALHGRNFVRSESQRQEPNSELRETVGAPTF